MSFIVFLVCVYICGFFYHLGLMSEESGSLLSPKETVVPSLKWPVTVFKKIRARIAEKTGKSKEN